MSGERLRVVVVGLEPLAQPLRECFRGELRVVVLAAKLLDGDVARGVDLGARDDPRRPVLVPHPDVLHLHVEEGIAGLRRRLEVELVTEVRRVRRQDAVAEERKDGRVLALQRELELGLELVEIVEMAHRPSVALQAQWSPASRSDTRPWPGITSSGSRSRSGSRAKWRSCRRGGGTVRPGTSAVSSAWKRRVG